ncbi:hypothetical protein L211DRAFT_326497 [Terfezia boudieri ATCC MYA-4762]|uniref:Uncharacterized protein n=1 Tax=Terfezia boudieri ATCC MYA-4762 TaxID=1051890 RepID=A0A3N4LMF0_9PEZI|nr:hypothetical protein L211DRAFT_326497 [Terfezia boudieri ATCC MYA-4762]
MYCYTCLSLLATSCPRTITVDGCFCHAVPSPHFLYHQTADTRRTTHTCSWQQLVDPFCLGVSTISMYLGSIYLFCSLLNLNFSSGRQYHVWHATIMSCLMIHINAQ